MLGNRNEFDNVPGTLFRRHFVVRLIPHALWGPAFGEAIGCSHPHAMDAVSSSKVGTYTATHASVLLETILEASARDVVLVGARPTILSRSHAIAVTAMFDAWSAYDAHAAGTRLRTALRRPAAERTDENRKTAMNQAVMRALVSVYPTDTAFLDSEFAKVGFAAKPLERNRAAPHGIGNLAADALFAFRAQDHSNASGAEGNGKPYSDTVGYRPTNPADTILDPDRWQPIAFDDGKGGTVTPGFLTPHWSKVTPFALTSADQSRPGPPPNVVSEQLFREAEDVRALNAGLTCEQKALVEFMRDGPRSTGQSGHWLHFARMVSERDRHDLDTAVKLYFTIANVAFDAFIAAWDSKLAYNSSRPWTLIHHYFQGKDILGWGGPDKGAVTIKGEKWRPYSPPTFVTPPFPGYVSGHSCVSSACAEALRLFTKSDTFGVIEKRPCGVLTGEHLNETIALPLKTFRQTAELAGFSRTLGGYHIQADNLAGLEFGQRVAQFAFPRIASYVG